MTRIKVLHTEQYIHNLNTRMPFHYGIARVSYFPHLFLRLTCEINGRVVEGVAADGLIPKWFTKDPAAVYENELTDMLNVIEAACTFAGELDPFPTVFIGWQQLYQRQADWAAEQGYPPLLWNFGVSLVERALIAAFCKAEDVSLAQAVRRNLLGVELGAIHPELAGHAPVEFLPPEPLRQIAVRHTIGMADYLWEADIPEAERLADGLPQSLEACLQVYAYRYFKIKVGGDPEMDLDRLCRIAALLKAKAAPDYAFTLDGNEQYASLGQFRSFWDALWVDGKLAAFLEHLLFVEQPLKRAVALTDASGSAIRAWEAGPPLIIDESDADLTSLPRAIELGYCGTSSQKLQGHFQRAGECLLFRVFTAGRAGKLLLLERGGPDQCRPGGFAAGSGADGESGNPACRAQWSSLFPWPEHVLFCAAAGDAAAPFGPV